jgi:hypothetical protein
MDQAIVTLLAVVVGGLISAITTAYLESQRRKHDEMKRLKERLEQKILRRYDAYIKFLSLNPATACEINPLSGRPKEGFVKDVGLETASVLAYGSINIATKLVLSYPLREWEQVKAIQNNIVEELRDERLQGDPSSEKLPQLPPSQEEAKAKSWWRFWR